MVLRDTKLKGAFIIEAERTGDERGFFARAWCKKEFEAHGLDSRLVQSNISFNKKRGTLRGMHYQVAPHEETKLVRCTTGAIFDVIIDLRPESVTYKQWIGVELRATNHKMLYVPKGFAHGFQTLEDNTEVFYHVSEFYSARSERGVRWNDQTFGIKWPETESRVISEKDKNWPDYLSKESAPLQPAGRTE